MTDLFHILNRASDLRDKLDYDEWLLTILDKCQSLQDSVEQSTALYSLALSKRFVTSNEMCIAATSSNSELLTPSSTKESSTVTSQKSTSINGEEKSTSSFVDRAMEEVLSRLSKDFSQFIPLGTVNNSQSKYSHGEQWIAHPSVCRQWLLDVQSEMIESLQLESPELKETTNPEFAEWMMGLPRGVSGLKPMYHYGSTSLMTLEQIERKERDRHCEFCGKLLRRKKYKGKGKRPEDLGRFYKRRFCNRECKQNSEGSQKISRDGYRKRAKKFKKSFCEMCGTTENLQIHHVDEDWSNNSPENLMTLCTTHHMTHHWKDWRFSEEKLCVACGEPAVKLGFCEKHYKRFQKYGNPYLTKKRDGSSYELIEEIPDTASGLELYEKYKKIISQESESEL